MKQSSANTERRAYSVVEAARLIGISRASFYELIGKKKIATVKVGGRRLVPASTLDQLLSEGAQ